MLYHEGCVQAFFILLVVLVSGVAAGGEKESCVSIGMEADAVEELLKKCGASYEQVELAVKFSDELSDCKSFVVYPRPDSRYAAYLFVGRQSDGDESVLIDMHADEKWYSDIKDGVRSYQYKRMKKFDVQEYVGNKKEYKETVSGVKSLFRQVKKTQQNPFE